VPLQFAGSNSAKAVRIQTNVGAIRQVAPYRSGSRRGDTGVAPYQCLGNQGRHPGCPLPAGGGGTGGGDTGIGGGAGTGGIGGVGGLLIPPTGVGDEEVVNGYVGMISIYGAFVHIHAPINRYPLGEVYNP